MIDIQSRISVIDSGNGSGKTSWAIDYINQLPEDTKIIYITPFLNEVKRIIENCPNRNFRQPEYKYGEGSKMLHLIKLVSDGENIVSTHALFQNIDYRVISALKLYDYILILDEVMNVVNQYNFYNETKKMSDEKRELLTMDDIRYMLEKQIISVGENNIVSWVKTTSEGNHRYDDVKRLSEDQLLHLINNTLLMWTFPITIFREGIFSKIFILTYLFKYQLQSSYYDFYKLDYLFYHIEKINNIYEIVKTENSDYDINWKNKIKPLIKILDNEKLNRIGSIYLDERNHPYKSALSKAWYDRNNDINIISKLGDNTVNFFQNYTSSKSNERLWTTFKEYKKLLRNKNLPYKQWLEINSRSTNDHKEVTAMAYLVNRYPQPYFEDFFETEKIKIDIDGFGLSEMVQWVFRSAIREERAIDLYVPSERMRTLFHRWLNNEKIEF